MTEIEHVPIEFVIVCHNPDCSIEFSTHKKNKLYCCPKCRNHAMFIRQKPYIKAYLKKRYAEDPEFRRKSNEYSRAGGIKSWHTFDENYPIYGMTMDDLVGLLRFKGGKIEIKELKSNFGWWKALHYADKAGLVTRTETLVELKDTPLLAATDGYFASAESKVTGVVKQGMIATRLCDTKQPKILRKTRLESVGETNGDRIGSECERELQAMEDKG